VDFKLKLVKNKKNKILPPAPFCIEGGWES